MSIWPPDRTAIAVVENGEITGMWHDEATHLPRDERKRRAKSGWFNWYINRGRLPLEPTRAEMRALSWRRAH